MDLTGKKILVLGGSGALGSRFVSEFLNQGATVYATSKSENTLNKIPSGAINFALDLTSTSAVNEFADQFDRVTEDLDGIVIASGGVGFATIETTSNEMYSEITNLNYVGPAQLVSKLAEKLKNHKIEKAFVVAITGVVVEQSFPGMAAYSASKSALSSFIKTLDKEWRKFKISGFDVHLGHTETGLADRAMFGVAPNMPAGYSTEHAIQVILEKLSTDTRIINSADFG